MKTFKQFLSEKGISEDAWKSKTAEEMAALHKEYNEAVQKEIETALKGKLSEDEAKKLIEDAVKGIEGFATEKQMTDLEASMKAISEAVTALKINGAKEDENFSEALGKALTVQAEKLKALKTNKGESVRIELKAVGNMTFATNITGQIPVADREAGITRIVRRNPFLLSLIATSPIKSNLWEWVEQKNPEGEPAMTAEGVKKAQIDFDLVTADAKVRKVTAFIKVTKEMLDDIDGLQAEINQELTERIALVIDTQLLSGDNLGENLMGLEANATPFAVGTFADTIAEPNNADVLKVAVNQVMINEFDPNVILMHPSDVTAMELEKASDGHYILPPFRNAEGTLISGVRVVANTGVTQDEFIVADITKYAARIKEGLTIDVGYENDDFTKNFVTILAESRLVARIKSNHYGAVVKGNFAASKLLLDSAV